MLNHRSYFQNCLTSSLWLAPVRPRQDILSGKVNHLALKIKSVCEYPLPAAGVAADNNCWNVILEGRSFALGIQKRQFNEPARIVADQEH